jgi:hypothetical protein
VTVPETDAGGWGEQPEALERTVVKELGKMTPNLWKKGCLSSFSPSAKGEQAAKKRLNRLFTKNIGLCERESGSIGAQPERPSQGTEAGTPGKAVRPTGRTCSYGWDS